MTKFQTNRLDRPNRDSQVISRISSLHHSCRELRALRPPARPCKSSGVSHAAGPNAEGGPGCAAHRAPPVTRHISRLCDSYGKFCELQMLVAQCKCNGYCGQRREIPVSRCCRSRFFTEVNEPFRYCNLWSVGWELSISALHYIVAVEQIKVPIISCKSINLPQSIKSGIRWLHRSGLGTQCLYNIRLN